MIHTDDYVCPLCGETIFVGMGNCPKCLAYLDWDSDSPRPGDHITYFEGATPVFNWNRLSIDIYPKLAELERDCLMSTDPRVPAAERGHFEVRAVKELRHRGYTIGLEAAIKKQAKEIRECLAARKGGDWMGDDLACDECGEDALPRVEDCVEVDDE